MGEDTSEETTRDAASGDASSDAHAEEESPVGETDAESPESTDLLADAREAQDNSRKAESVLAALDPVCHRWEEAKTELEEKEAEVSAARERVEQTTTDARLELSAATEAASEPLRKARRLLEQVQLGATRIEREVRELRAHVEERRLDRAKHQVTLEPLEQHLASLAKTMSASEEELASLRTREGECLERVASLTASLTKASEALTAKSEEAARLSKDSEEARALSSKELDTIKTAEGVVTDHKATLELRRSAHSDAEAVLAKAEARVGEEKTTFGAAEEALGGAKALEKEARQAQLESSQRLARAESDEELSAAEEDHESTLEAWQTKRADLKPLKAKLADAEESVSHAEAAADAAREALEELRQAVEVAETDLATAEASLEHLRGSSDALQRAEDKAREAKSAAELRDLAEVVAQGLEVELTESTRDLEVLRVRMATTAGSHTAREQERQTFEAKRGECDQLIEGADEQLAAAEDEVRARESALSGEQGAQQRLLLDVQRVEALHQLRSEQLADLQALVPQAPSPDLSAEVELEAESWGALAWCEEAQTEPEPEEESAGEEHTQGGQAEAKSADPSPLTFRLSVSLPNHHVGDFEFAQEEVVLGRDASADVTLDSPVISRRHAVIRRHDNLFALIDMGSGNGTFLNGKRAEGLALLNDGDGLGIGKYRMRFSADTDAGFGLGAQLSVDALELGGMTLRLTPEDAQRQGGEHGRVRGTLVLPGLKGKEPVKVPLSEVFMIGKDPACDMCIKGWFAPKKAALICRGFDRYTLINVGPSAKDVLANDVQVSTNAPLKHNDRIEVYGQRFVFLLPEPLQAGAS